ncbi:MAG: hypothetical protein ACHQT8_03975 [Chlamydiales bacterium]
MGANIFSKLPRPLASLVLDYCYESRLMTRELIVRKITSTSTSQYVSLDFDFEKIEKIFFEAVHGVLPIIKYFVQLDMRVSHVDSLQKFAITTFIYKEKEVKTLDPVFQLNLFQRVTADADSGRANPAGRKDYYRSMMKIEKCFTQLNISKLSTQKQPSIELMTDDILTTVEQGSDEHTTGDFHGSLLPFLMI